MKASLMFTTVLVLALSYTLLAGAAETSSPDASNLRTSITTDRNTYGRNEPVNITIIVENVGDSPVTLHLPNGCGLSYFVVEDVSGTVAYDWRHDFACPLMVGQRTIFPGEQHPQNFTWTQLDNSGRQVHPGTYTVRAVFWSYESLSPAVTEISIQGAPAPVMATFAPWIVIAGVAGSSLGVLGWRRRKNRKDSPHQQ